MTTRLSPDGLARYQRDGFHFPVPVLSTAEAQTYRRRLEAIESDHGGRLTAELRHKPHLLFTWLADLVRHPAILDAVESVLGPNLLVWTTNFFIKEARDPSFVSWHQDATYWGLSGPDVLTAWVAFTDATVENGAMRMVPGSHGEQHGHRDTFAPHNLLSRGQEIEVEVDEARGEDILLRAGEMSLLPLVLLAHVDEERVVGVVEPHEDVRRGDLVDLLLDPCEQLPVGRHYF